MKYTVTGIAFCPVYVTVEGVEASSAKKAEEKAKQMARAQPKKYVVGNSSDEDHWFDWKPLAEPASDNKPGDQFRGQSAP